MRPPKIDDAELLDRLTEVFRTHGYEGASLSRISEATGLRRASLYHRFPGGKDEMARAVLEHVDERIAGRALAALRRSGDPAARVRAMAKELDAFYSHGRKSCILDTLSVGDPQKDLRRHIGRSMAAWLKALATVARDGGATPAVARRRAEEALVRIEGGLVLARGLEDPGPFARVLQTLPELLAPGGDS